jgi:hypothetical protein
MSSIEHFIRLSVINDRELPMSATVIINNHVVIQKPLTTSENIPLNFLYDYQNHADNFLKIEFKGEEQPSKRITIKQISINHQPINVFSGFYIPDQNDWWQNLSETELEFFKKKIFSHGGELGWFGSITYEYVNKRQSWHKKDPWTFNRKKIFL